MRWNLVMYIVSSLNSSLTRIHRKCVLCSNNARIFHRAGPKFSPFRHWCVFELSKAQSLCWIQYGRTCVERITHRGQCWTQKIFARLGVILCETDSSAGLTLHLAYPMCSFLSSLSKGYIFLVASSLVMKSMFWSYRRSSFVLFNILYAAWQSWRQSW